MEYSVGLDLTNENFFKPEKNILSETKVLNGKFDSHYDRFYFKNETINNNNNVIKIVELYDKRLLNIILEFTKEIYNFTLITSTNFDNNVVVFTINNYNDNFKLIFYEIQIKIQINNLNIKQLVEDAIVPIKLKLSEIDDEKVKNILIKFCLFWEY